LVILVCFTNLLLLLGLFFCWLHRSLLFDFFILINFIKFDNLNLLVSKVILILYFCFYFIFFVSHWFLYFLIFSFFKRLEFGLINLGIVNCCFFVNLLLVIDHLSKIRIAHFWLNLGCLWRFIDILFFLHWHFIITVPSSQQEILLQLCSVKKGN